MTRTKNQLENCPSCGAPVTSEICPYCGTPTGLDTARADMEYPVIECKESTVDFWNVCFPGIFALTFGSAGLVVLITGLVEREPMALIGIPFLLVGIGACYFVMRTLSRYIKIKTKGKKITATVYGYMNDNVLINGLPAQIVKLLVQTPGGPRFILYQLGDTKQPYGVNTQINLVVYEDCFMIDKRRETIDWG